MIRVSLDSDHPHARSYWSTLKLRLAQEGNETITKLIQVKMLATDHKMRFTDVADEKTWAEIRQIVERISFDKLNEYG